MNRRRFLKYAGATATVVGASALGLEYVLSSRPGPVINQTATSLNQTTSSPRTNNPPRFLWPPFNMKPKYILPTPQYAIELSPNAVDDDNDPLSFTWSVDGKEVSHENNYSTKLAGGDHEIDLTASDGKASVFSKSTLTVEPDQIYPTRPLHIKHKGIRYFPQPPDKMSEELDIIREELGCNGIIISGEEGLIDGARLAVQKGYDHVYVEPSYWNNGNGITVDETVERIGELAPRVRELRQMSDSIGFAVGHELGLVVSDIIPGDNWDQRVNYTLTHNDWLGILGSKLPPMFKRIIQICKKNYGYGISYSAALPEDDIVPWSDPIFESVGTDAYVMDSAGWTEGWIAEHLSSLKRYGKPVNSMEWGCMTFKGAGPISASWRMYEDQHPYDEDEQATYIRRYCEMLNRVRIDGCYYTGYNQDENDAKGYSLQYQMKRKKGFYMYKSYQRVT